VCWLERPKNRILNSHLTWGKLPEPLSRTNHVILWEITWSTLIDRSREGINHYQSHRFQRNQTLLMISRDQQQQSDGFAARGAQTLKSGSRIRGLGFNCCCGLTAYIKLAQQSAQRTALSSWSHLTNIFALI
jgi:hypothetical protein